MTLAEIITRLQEVYGDSLISSDAYYTRTVNDAYFKLNALADWWWLEKDYVVVANAVATTVVASATINTAAVLLSASIPTTYGVRCWCESPEHIFRVETIVTGTAMTLDSNWIETTTTSVSLNLWGDTFVLPTDFEHPIQVTYRGDERYPPLTRVELSDIEAFGANVFDFATDRADRYCIYPNPDNTSASKTYLMRIFPPPDEINEYLLRYRMCPASLSATTDIPILPERYHPVLVDYAKLELFRNEGEDGDRIAEKEREVSRGVGMLMRQNSQRGNVQWRAGRRGLSAIEQPARVHFKNTESGI